MPEPLVSCRSVSKVYETPGGKLEALHSVDAVFALGEITAVVGSSGSGKSTLLRALAGLDRPSGGSLLVGGAELAGARPAELRRHRRSVVTYVSQRPFDNFIPYLTVSEQAEDAGAGAGPLLDEFGLGHRLASHPAELSGGEQARAAFALALARGTPLLVSDEPTAELDAGSSAPLLAAIRSHAGAGVAVVVATHDPAVIEIADRVLRLDRGRVIDPDQTARPAGRSTPAAHADPAVVLELSQVGKHFRRGSDTIEAVREASLELRRGELGALVGRSGSGKTTLLTLAARLHEPDSGSIRFPLGPERGRPRWDQLAFLPQRFGLLPELSVRENVQYPARLAGRLDEAGARIEDLLERLGLAEHAARFPFETSIGQQQRTALARALALEPTLLLADEPTSHQDAGWRDGVWRVLVAAAESGTACLIATHEPEIARYATRVWEIAGGSIVDH